MAKIIEYIIIVDFIIAIISAELTLIFGCIGNFALAKIFIIIFAVSCCFAYVIDILIKIKQKGGFIMSENKKEKKEMVNHPEHYKGNKFEVIEIIEDYNLGFNLGNAVKYILRCEKKANKKQDLEKAIWYIQREIKNTNEKREKDIATAPFIIKSGICQSCGMPYDIKDGELICEECHNKYVDENENEYKCVDNRNINRDRN